MTASVLLPSHQFPFEWYWWMLTTNLRFYDFICWLYYDILFEDILYFISQFYTKIENFNIAFGSILYLIQKYYTKYSLALFSLQKIKMYCFEFFIQDGFSFHPNHSGLYMGEIWYVIIHTYVVLENTTFSTKALWVLLTSGFFGKNQHFLPKWYLYSKQYCESSVRDFLVLLSAFVR